MQALNYNDPLLLDQVAQLAAVAMSPNIAERGVAEEQVRTFQDSVDRQLGFVMVLLRVIQQRPAAAPFISVVLKNTVKLCWAPGQAEHCVQPEDKQVLRSEIIGVMLGSDGTVQRNLAETITLMADVDFPSEWPDALSLIIATLAGGHPVPQQCAALSTAHSILVKYRDVGDFTEGFVRDMLTVYALLFAPLLGAMEAMLEVCETDQTPLAIEACRGMAAAVECLIDITTLDLSDDFVTNITRIVDLLQRSLALQNPCLVRAVGHDGGPLVALKSVAVACVRAFLTNYDEDFEKYAGGFLEVVWNVVADPASAAPAMDDLVICGLELLASACVGTTRGAFEDPAVLQGLVSSAIIPSLVLHEDEIDMYDADPDAYIQRDMEGSDLHTRRRAAGELVRALVKTFPELAWPLFESETELLLQGKLSNATGSLAPWRAKDAGIFLMTSLALEGQHVDAQRGVTLTQLSNRVPFAAFLSSTVLPELVHIGPGETKIIKADCLRVVAAFREHIPLSSFPDLLLCLPAWIAVDGDVVLATYGAHTVESLLLARQGQSQPVVTEEMFAPHAEAILQALCHQLSAAEQPNAYVAQCLLRIVVRLPATTGKYIESIILCVNGALIAAAKNPSSPLYSHCLFEVVSKLIAQHPKVGGAFEQVLWPCLSDILTKDVAEFMPYALQIFAQLLGAHSKGESEPPEHFKSLLPPLAEMGVYRQRGNIPAVVCLLTRFIALYPAYVHGQGLTVKVLNIFSTLVKLKLYDHEGLNILTSIVLYYPPEVVSEYLPRALQILLERLRENRTPKFVRALIIFLSITVCVHGPALVISLMEGIQKDLFFMVLGNVWLPNMQKVTGELERKVCVVALARLLTESETLQTQSEAWVQSVYNCLRMIHDRVEADDHTSFAPQTATINDLARRVGTGTGPAAAGSAGVGDANGFSNVFCPLEDAVQKPVDVCASVANPDQYFRDQMRQLLNGPRGGALFTELSKKLDANLMALIQ